MPEKLKAERAKRIDAARARFAKIETLTEEDRKALFSLNFLDFPKVVTALPGFEGDSKLESLLIARRQFEMACDTLLQLLDDFHAFSDTPGFHHRSARHRFDLLIDRIRKELFTVSTLAHSVQDHCRRVRGAWNPPDFIDHLAACFGDDGLHDFVIALRNGLHHQRVLGAPMVGKRREELAHQSQARRTRQRGWRLGKGPPMARRCTRRDRRVLADNGIPRPRRRFLRLAAGLV